MQLVQGRASFLTGGPQEITQDENSEVTHLSCDLDCRIRDGVNGIHLTTDKMGRRLGGAFLEIEHEEDVSKALEKHRQYLGPRYLEGLSFASYSGGLSRCRPTHRTFLRYLGIKK